MIAKLNRILIRCRAKTACRHRTIQYFLPSLAVMAGLLGLAPAANALTLDQAEIRNNGELRIGGSVDNNGQVSLRILDANGAQTGNTETVDARRRNWSYKERPARSPACTAEASQGGTTLTMAIEPLGRPECDVVQTECNISVSPTALNFGDVQINTTSFQSTTVSNTGTADCNVDIVQSGSPDFAATPLNFVVAPNASQTVSVNYTPGEVGPDSGNLAVGSNDPNNPNVDVSLSGNGVDLSLIHI